MSILARKNAKLSAKTNDFSLLTWDTLDKTIKDAELLVGKNSVIRYGIATETDVGVPVTKHVLVPVFDDISDPRVAEKMYTTNAVMIGTHELVTSSGDHVAEPFPLDRSLAKLGAAEFAKRDKLDDTIIIPGEDFKAVPALTGNEDNYAWLTYVCAYLNYRQFKLQYAPDNIKDPYLIAGSHAVAMAYRNGLLESYAAREYQFVQVKRADNGDCLIVRLDVNYAQRTAVAWKPNDTIAAKDLRMSAQLSELGLGLVVGAGSTHFMMNHTTGGAKMGGHNVRALTVNGLYEMDPSDLSPSEAVQTSFYYNVLHPVNKRAIASLCIPAAKVNTWYKNAYLPAPAVMYSDTFMAYRQNLVPAGTHKAYVAMLALRAIGDASLIPFLPDPNVVELIISTYERIRDAGARAHVGSRYYTGEPPAVSQADVDMFLPFAAYFVQTRMRSASLAASPHLSVEHAASAPSKWKNIIDLTVKTSADSAPAEQIIAYLVKNGAQGIRFDLNTNEGISDAGAFNDALVKRIAKVI